MLITSIYCAHNMGAHCACSPRSPSCLISNCSSSLSSTLVDSGSSGYVRRMHRWTRCCCCCWLRCVSFSHCLFFAFFLLLVLFPSFFYSYCSCTANSIIVNANFCPIPNPIPLRMFCFSIEDSRRTFSVSAFYLLLIYATLARSRHTPSRLPAPLHRLTAPPTLACRALFTQTIVEYLPSMLIEFFPVD